MNEPLDPPDYTEQLEYQEFVEEMAKECHCQPSSERPCESLLAGGPCEMRNTEPQDLVDELFSEDDEG